jgi:predicted CoA-substrate-specific enzyme activase
MIERFFTNDRERKEFQKGNKLVKVPVYHPRKGEHLKVYLGIDAGSTTSKFALLNEKGELIDSFYSSNRGEPLTVIQNGLKALFDRFEQAGAELEILGAGTTGYGENLFAKAFKADYHCVETVAHARAAQKYASDVSFILDIGGQDMKAISLSDGIVSGIILNEACSAGCGSFVETYAKSLGVAVEDIAEKAFNSEHPSKLGSRCTVFMNSSIITEQKNGKTTEDILAGICRSIIENVFTKVIRISNLDQLGDSIVVQGGTFKNDAVLRALEQYAGRKVIRAPYPGEMGAIGIALLTKEHVEAMQSVSGTIGTDWKSSFLSAEQIRSFSYEKQPGVVCKFCSNNCMRTVVSFPDGSSHVTGNRCEKGEVLGDLSQASTRLLIKEKAKEQKSVPDMMELQAKKLFSPYPANPVRPPQNITIGIPKVLEFFNSAPSWTTLFHSLGFKVVFSEDSSYELFDKSLPFVPSDTICFPAKLAHGHIEDLCEKGVDRIFFPSKSRGIKDVKSADANFNCTVILGYALVTEKSNETIERYGIPLDRPLFHWSDRRIKVMQICEYLEQTFGIKPGLSRKAIKQGENAMRMYKQEMEEAGQKAMDSISGKDAFGVLLAGRPYHLDSLVNHNLSKHFTRLGIPVFTLDSLPDSHNVSLEGVRMETVINFHTRMLTSAFQAAKQPKLELVQIVSFGCGHDAIISDEMARILKEMSKKELLILKMDEGEAAGPLSIRIKSFIETVRARRSRPHLSPAHILNSLKEAFPYKFKHKDKKIRTIYIPNLSPAFSYCFSQILQGSGYRLTQLPLADSRAIELGKKYVHNDICYPAQINIGEFLAQLESGKLDPSTAALAIAKNCEDCRAGQYASLARKALDEAGFPSIPIVTTGKDSKNMHPGFSLKLKDQWNALWGLTLIDALERMRRRIRPYELKTGQSENVFSRYMVEISQQICNSKKKSMELLKRAIHDFNSIPIKDEARRPRVGIIGEILLNYHPAANGYLENYLESHGMEVVLPDMHDFFRRGHFIFREMGKRRVTGTPSLDFLINDMAGRTFDFVRMKVNKLMESFRFENDESTIQDIADNIKDMIDITYQGGEGWKIPGEIIQMAKHGVNAFVIVQPFGCLPNHITGRGFMKPLKKILPHIHVLSLDYDPDTSFANVENRLQMMIMNIKEKANENKRSEGKVFVKTNQ